MAELNLITREQLMATLDPTEGLTHKDVELGPSGAVNFQEIMEGQPARVKINGEEHQLTDAGLQQSATCIGIPATYSKRCPYHMLRDHLNFWCAAPGKKMRFFLRDGKVVGAYKNHPDYHSNVMLHDNIVAGVEGTPVLGYHQVSTDLDYSRFCLVLDKTFEPKTGDTLYGGISVQNSIFGSKALEVTPYIFRQWCSNGAITSESLSKWSRRSNNKEDIALWAQSAASRSVRELDCEFNRIKQLTEIGVVGQIDSTLKSIFRKFGISVRTQSIIRDEVAKQNDGIGSQNMYDVYNAITAVGTHNQALSSEAARNLQLVAGDITKDYAMCDKCHQVLL